MSWDFPVLDRILNDFLDGDTVSWMENVYFTYSCSIIAIITAYVLGIAAYVYTLQNWTTVETSMYWSPSNYSAPY